MGDEQTEDKSVGRRLAHLVGNPKYSDFTFRILEDGKDIPAHKAIISSASLVVEKIVTGSLGLAGAVNSTAEVDDISSANFLEVLRFMYTDQATVTTENAFEILRKANYYGISKLERQCIDILCKSISTDSVWLIYNELFDYYSYEAVVKKCLNFVALSSKTVLDHESFLELNVDPMRQVLSLPATNIGEIDLYKGLLKWATHVCNQEQISVTPENMRKVCNGLEKCIRFATLSMNEFDLCLSFEPTKFLTMKEIEEIRNKIKCGGDSSRRHFLTCQGTTWILRSNTDPLPPNAVYIGHNYENSPTYVARYSFQGKYYPAEFIPSEYCAFSNLNGCREEIHECEVLCGYGYEWVFPECIETDWIDAVAACSEATEPIYIGRTKMSDYYGSSSVGRIKEDKSGIVIADEENANELEYNKYEYLRGRNIQPLMSQDVVPDDAIIGGSLADGTLLYIGHAYHEGDILPAQITPGRSYALVSHGCHSHRKEEYAYLRVSNTEWVSASEGQVPKNAIVGGRTNYDEVLFIGRARHPEANNNYITGKVHPSHRVMYIAFEELEIAFRNYEVLVHK